MNKSGVLAELLINFRGIDKEKYDKDQDLSNIRIQIEKLYACQSENSFNNTIIADIINIFTNSGCNNKQLVICLSKALSADNLKCCDQNQRRRLLKWLERGRESLDLDEVVASLRISANIVKSDLGFLGDVAELLLSKDNIGALLKCFDVTSVKDCNKQVEIIQSLDIIASFFNDKNIEDKYIEPLESIAKAILEIYYKCPNYEVPTDVWIRFLLFTLSFISKVCSISTSFGRTYISDLLGVIKACWNYGVGEKTWPQSLTKIHPSQQYYQDSREEDCASVRNKNVGGKLRKERKPKTCLKKKGANVVIKETELVGNVEEIYKMLDMKSSESEASENEMGENRMSKLNKQRTAKIRFYAITLLGQVMSVQERCVLYGYWHAIFPSGVCKSNDHILSVTLSDPNIRCRGAALQVAAQLLFCSKQFLAQAESIRQPATFLPFSASLALDIIATQECLLSILDKENSVPVIVQALKCIALLVQATSFEQLEAGLAAKIINEVRKFMDHRDATVQVATLMVFEFFVTPHRILPEIVENLGFPKKTFVLKQNELETDEILDDEVDNMSVETPRGEETPQMEVDNEFTLQKETPASFWLLEYILSNLNTKLTPSVGIANLQVLNALATHVYLFGEFLEDIANVLRPYFDDQSHDIRLNAIRCTDALAYHVSRILGENSSPSKIESMKCKQFWGVLLPVLQKSLCEDKDQNPKFKVSACDAISNIGEVIYEMQPSITQMSLISFLSGIASDANEDSSVTSAAIRALAVFSHFNSLRRDLVFIENVSELSLRLCSDSNILVRIKSVWSLANVSDALMANLTDELTNNETISDDLFHRLIVSAIQACTDIDKVRCNAVRCLGNLIRTISPRHIENDKFKLLVQKAIDTLNECISSSGNAKVKWNSCYAISNLIRNKNIFKTKNSWQQSLYQNLCNTIVNHQNFKVRINATQVILNIDEREHFGAYYDSFTSAVLRALEQTYHLDNFFEYNHRDQLQEQLCLAIVHIVSLATAADLTNISNNISKYGSVLNNTWRRVINRMVPEKVAPLLVCVENLHKKIEAQTNLTGKNLESIEVIRLALKAD